ncbi:MAG: PEP-CTERM sorting domain-containing protein [Colwellia sp.]|jgi:hypothetical protein|uniref:PEP-CTERM sorting domain-containing protein n=1 Tax=Colwellia sp. Bg11-12 TaxID=2759817 RepID=UPI002174F772|nr:PEP-CTERM sorting domain-containing protein [Colwellia sp. Bg11-12]
MKFIFLKSALLGAILSISNFANAGLIPHGVQEDVSYTDVTNSWGWNLLYRGDYASSINVSSMFSGHQDYIMLGAINGSSNTIKLLAAVKWTDFITHTAQNVTKSLNGAEWYNNGGSLGFAHLGDSIRQGSADTRSENAGKRLSWHTSGGYGTTAISVNGGWRAGSVTNLNNSTSWDRVVFTTNATVDVPEPSTLAIFALGMIGLASRRFKNQS